MRTGDIIVIKTTLPPEAVNAIMLTLFAKWVSFAMGRDVLGGRKLMYPTGRYASSLQFREEGQASVAIIADSGIAPEAAILEHGHAQFDLKTRLMRNRGYPMHRARTGPTKNNGGLLRTGSGPPGSTPRVWAEIRARESTGFASFGPNSDPDSWIMPAMVAYSPAQILASMAQSIARRLGG